jgi:hypothetical protein
MLPGVEGAQCKKGRELAETRTDVSIIFPDLHTLCTSAQAIMLG